MKNEFFLDDYRIIDLTKPLDPKTETRRLQVRKRYQKKTRDYHSEIDMMSHLGTHVESPFHCSPDLKDISELPLSTFIGRGIILYLNDIEPNERITAGDLESASEGKVREGDIVILDSPHKLPPFTELTNTDCDKRPYVCDDTANWLKLKKVKGVGFGDGVSIEFDVRTIVDFHEILMPDDIIFIEVLKNLELIRSETFLFCALPLPVSGLDSCPVRAIAIEGMAGF
ncbi:MAG: cyclase family protein [Clostridia bacterium]